MAIDLGMPREFALINFSRASHLRQDRALCMASLKVHCLHFKNYLLILKKIINSNANKKVVILGKSCLTRFNLFLEVVSQRCSIDIFQLIIIS